MPIRFEAEGGKIIGVGNGDPACHEPDISDSRTSFNGLALCIVEKTAEKLYVKAYSEQIGAGEYCTE